MKKTYETWCPLFPGFYNTIFEYDSEDEEIREYNREHEINFTYDDFDWDYSDYHQRVSKGFVKEIESKLKEKLPIKIKYQQLSSPQYYNFKNDSINIEVTVSLPRLLKWLKENAEEASSYFIENYTSYDGFISYHSNDINDWLKKEYIMEEPAHRIGALLDCFYRMEITDDYIDVYYELDDVGYCSFKLKETADEKE